MLTHTYKNNVFSAFFSANETHEKHARDYHITTELVAKHQQSAAVQQRAYYRQNNVLLLLKLITKYTAVSTLTHFLKESIVVRFVNAEFEVACSERVRRRDRLRMRSGECKRTKKQNNNSLNTFSALTRDNKQAFTNEHA